MKPHLHLQISQILRDELRELCLEVKVRDSLLRGRVSPGLSLRIAMLRLELLEHLLLLAYILLDEAVDLVVGEKGVVDFEDLSNDQDMSRGCVAR